MIVKQAEKDLQKLKEKLLQLALDKENRESVIDAFAQQEQNERDFAESVDNLRELGQCFWRFAEVEPILNTVLRKFEEIMEKKRRQLALYVKQVQGQFVLIADQIEVQRKQFMKVDEHLRREQAFRDKVFKREMYEVMGLIEEYEALKVFKGQQPEDDTNYSELLPDLDYVFQNLINAQLNLDTLVIFTDRDQPMSMSLINEMKDENKMRVIDVQRKTAKGVLKRFYKNMKGAEKGV